MRQVMMTFAFIAVNAASSEYYSRRVFRAALSRNTEQASRYTRQSIRVTWGLFLLFALALYMTH